jgi:hypothetical protein
MSWENGLRSVKTISLVCAAASTRVASHMARSQVLAGMVTTTVIITPAAILRCCATANILLNHAGFQNSVCALNVKA